MKRALVLAGGGSKGAYEAGFIKALNELGITFDIVTGTSIGALNGCLCAQQDFEALYDLWDHLDSSKVLAEGFEFDPKFDLNDLMNQSNLALSFFKKYVQEKGVDFTPLKEIIRDLLDEDKLLSSPIDFGLCTVYFPSLKPLFITKKEMEKENIMHYLIASASCFPVFPIYTFNGQDYIDGGYYDNVPIDLAFEMGADEVIVVDMSTTPTHQHFRQMPNVIYTNPYTKLGGFMDFDPAILKRNCQIGYLTAMKRFGDLKGCKYTFYAYDSPLYVEFYKEILFLEKYFRNKFIKNTHIISDKFLEYHQSKNLKEEDYTFVVLDWICDELQKEVTEIYEMPQLFKSILSYYEPYFNRNYHILDEQEDDSLFSFVSSLNRKTLVGYMIHTLLYNNDDVKIDKEKVFVLFTEEVIIAKFIIMLYKQKF